MIYEIVLDFSVDDEEANYDSILAEAIEDGVQGVHGSVLIRSIRRR